MELSLFLAKLLGLYLLAVAAFFLLCKEKLAVRIREISTSKELIFSSGFIALVAGLAIAIGHPIWQLNWRLVITLLGYLMILQGVMRIAFTDTAVKIASYTIEKGYWAMIAILIILGVFLTYHGFTASSV